MSNGLQDSLFLGMTKTFYFYGENVLFCEAWESFTEAPRWAPNVPDKHYLDNLSEASQVRSQSSYL